MATVKKFSSSPMFNRQAACYNKYSQSCSRLPLDECPGDTPLNHSCEGSLRVHYLVIIARSKCAGNLLASIKVSFISSYLIKVERQQGLGADSCGARTLARWTNQRPRNESELHLVFSFSHSLNLSLSSPHAGSECLQHFGVTPCLLSSGVTALVTRLAII